MRSTGTPSPTTAGISWSWAIRSKRIRRHTGLSREPDPGDRCQQQSLLDQGGSAQLQRRWHEPAEGVRQRRSSRRLLTGGPAPTATEPSPRTTGSRSPDSTRRRAPRPPPVLFTVATAGLGDGHGPVGRPDRVSIHQAAPAGKRVRLDQGQQLVQLAVASFSVLASRQCEPASSHVGRRPRTPEQQQAGL